LQQQQELIEDEEEQEQKEEDARRAAREASEVEASTAQSLLPDSEVMSFPLNLVFFVLTSTRHSFYLKPLSKTTNT
jgi:hypothetical protein